MSTLISSGTNSTRLFSLFQTKFKPCPRKWLRYGRKTLNVIKISEINYIINQLYINLCLIIIIYKSVFYLNINFIILNIMYRVL